MGEDDTVFENLSHGIVRNRFKMRVVLAVTFVSLAFTYFELVNFSDFFIGMLSILV